MSVVPQRPTLRLGGPSADKTDIDGGKGHHVGADRVMGARHRVAVVAVVSGARFEAVVDASVVADSKLSSPCTGPLAGLGRQKKS